MKSRLVQRCQFRENPLSPGFDGHVALDYMGAAEFEWGALPKSLRKVKESLHTYVMVKTNVVCKDGCRLCLFCPEGQQDSVQGAFRVLLKEKFSTKEQTYLDKVIAGEKCWSVMSGPPDLWWDIENHYFVVKGEKKVEVLRKAIEESLLP